jgi:hypothetical protein
MKRRPSGNGHVPVTNASGESPRAATSSALAERDTDRHQAMVIEIGALAAGIVATISAIWGFHTVRKCREYGEGPW